MLTYANTNCGHCNAVHLPAHFIHENLATKRRAKELIFRLSQIYNRQGGGRQQPGGADLTRAQVERPVMLGVLRAGGLTFVAQSGGAHPAFQEALRRVQMTMPGLIVAGQIPAGAAVTRGGTAIAPATIAACQAGGGAPAPLSCAAPKLIHAANQHPAAAMPYHMTEIYYDGRSDERATVITATQNENLVYGRHSGHGVSQVSCATCQNTVPILMCPN